MGKKAAWAVNLYPVLFSGKKPKLPLITVFPVWRIVCKGVNGVDGGYAYVKIFS